jgi:hypothetical protein
LLPLASTGGCWALALSFKVIPFPAKLLPISPGQTYGNVFVTAAHSEESSWNSGTYLGMWDVGTGNYLGKCMMFGRALTLYSVFSSATKLEKRLCNAESLYSELYSVTSKELREKNSECSRTNTYRHY